CSARVDASARWIWPMASVTPAGDGAKRLSLPDADISTASPASGVPSGSFTVTVSAAVAVPSAGTDGGSASNEEASGLGTPFAPASIPESEPPRAGWQAQPASRPAAATQAPP